VRTGSCKQLWLLREVVKCVLHMEQGQLQTKLHALFIYFEEKIVASPRGLLLYSRLSYVECKEMFRISSVWIKQPGYQYSSLLQVMKSEQFLRRKNPWNQEFNFNCVSGSTLTFWSGRQKEIRINFRIVCNEIRDSLVGIAPGYGLDDRGSGIRFPKGAGDFSLLHRVQTGSGAHPASYPLGKTGSFPGGKAAGTWSWTFTSI
jgi:hypothetical protein